MTKTPLIMALDQGTTSSRTMIFDQAGKVVSVAQQEFRQHYPSDGWVEHDPEEIWATIRDTGREALAKAVTGEQKVAAIGITNQRETVVVWDRQTGTPVCNALVWQDRRTSRFCQELAAAGHEETVTSKTGLLIDPYFSASKIAWILDNVEGARTRAEAGELAFGTIDCFLIWRLTGGRVHATDETNASRTSLYNIHTGDWDGDLLALFNVPRSLLPEVKQSAADFGVTEAELFGYPIPICAAAGDQQSAAYGQLCTQPGMAKATYGTGCFVLVNTGHKAVRSTQRLLTTRACRSTGEPVFAVEGSIFIAGAVAQWLRDEMGLIETSADSETIASSLDSNGGVYLVPAFTGLGAPYWDSEARGAIFGLTRQSNRDHIIRAALESVAYQTEDLFQAFKADGIDVGIVRVDGGMTANNWLMQFISNITDAALERPENIETTAMGAAFLAGLQAGIWADEAELAQSIGPYTGFTPAQSDSERQTLLNAWKIAVKTTRYRAHLQAGAAD